MGIVWASIFWLTGIFAGQKVPLLPIHWVVLSLLCILAALALRKHTVHRSVFLLLLVSSLAGLRLRMIIHELTASDLGYYNDLDVEASITGTVIDDPDYREAHTALRVRAERLIIPALDVVRPIEGQVLVYANPYESWAYGDWVRVKGELKTPPQIDNFSYQQYLARKGIFSWMPRAFVLKLGEGRASPLLRWIYHLRQRLNDTVGKLFPDPEASLIAGILLGIESSIPDDLYEDFNRTGTTHIIAISGFNIALIANIIIASSRRFFGARRGLWIAATGITVYTVLVGADAAVVRAAVMAGLALLARYWGRETQGLASLGASSFVMTLVDPMVLWDVGFQLSFAATLGLVLYARPMHDWSVNTLSSFLSEESAMQLGGILAEFLLYTIAAQITTWPLTMYYFQRFSFISFVTNPMILPLQPALMILSGVATLLGTIWLPLGHLAAVLAWPFPALTIRIVSALSPFATAGFGLSGTNIWWVATYYAILVTATLLTRALHITSKVGRFFEPAGSRIRQRIAWILAAVALMTCVVWQSAAHSPDNVLHITFLDVGTGDAVLLQSPDGKYVLINGGPSPSRLMNQLGNKLPLLKREISTLIVAGTQTNQVAGLVGLINHLQIRHAVISPVQGSYSYRRVKEELQDAGISVDEVISGQQLTIDSDVKLKILSSGDSGMVLLASYRDARILIPTGIAPDIAAALQSDRDVHDVAVLLLGDGGHPSVNTRSWLETTNPWVVIISAGSKGDPNRPSRDVLALLGERTILRTDLNGSVEINTDGRELWIEVERVPTTE
jgi:competence protein ComEC